MVAGPDREGPPTMERIEPSSQTIAWFDFGERLGVMDFADEQYFSWVRSSGCWSAASVARSPTRRSAISRTLTTPVTLQLAVTTRARPATWRATTSSGSRRVPSGCIGTLRPARLSDEEIAVATSLVRMHQWLDGGPDICSLAHGAQDHYLGLMIDAAIASGEPVEVSGHLWDEPA